MASTDLMTEGLRLVLIGPDQQDNLALGYLASAAEAAGHQVAMVRFNGRADLDGAVAATLRLAPDAVGFGVPFQAAIGDYLELIALLRRRGFGGHLTCGGHVPTFDYRELLAAGPGLDTVVRHEGEVTLVELLGRLAAGQPLAGVPGVVWRDETGAPVVGGAAIDDLERVRGFALEQALEVNAANLELGRRFEALWDHYNQRGAALLRGAR